MENTSDKDKKKKKKQQTMAAALALAAGIPLLLLGMKKGGGLFGGGGGGGGCSRQGCNSPQDHVRHVTADLAAAKAAQHRPSGVPLEDKPQQPKDLREQLPIPNDPAVGNKQEQTVTVPFNQVERATPMVEPLDEAPDPMSRLRLEVVPTEIAQDPVPQEDPAIFEILENMAPEQPIQLTDDELINQLMQSNFNAF